MLPPASPPVAPGRRSVRDRPRTKRIRRSSHGESWPMTPLGQVSLDESEQETIKSARGQDAACAPTLTFSDFSFTNRQPAKQCRHESMDTDEPNSIKPVRAVVLSHDNGDKHRSKKHTPDSCWALSCCAGVCSGPVQERLEADLQFTSPSAQPHLSVAVDLGRIKVRRQAMNASSESLTSTVPTKYWHRLEDGRVQCDVCPRFCKLHEG